MMTQVVGKLSSEDLLKWRRITVRFEAVKLHPRAYSQNEVERVLGEYINFMGEIAERFRIEDTRDWDVTTHCGTVFYVEV